jgi:L-ascorbate metabolism protein UlaG (beta-lactamase superfamily)
MASFLFQGHASLRFVSDDNIVIYVDPYMGNGYDLPADIVLVTHQHFDHNRIDLIKQKNDCLVISNVEALKGGVYNTFKHAGVTISSVPAQNKNHNIDECVGYILSFDKLKLYCAGDTSCHPEMENLAKENLDYAFLPIDGVYNMSAEEACDCAKLISAKHVIPVHTAPDNGKDIRDNFSEENVSRFDCEGAIIVRHGEEISL